MNMLCLEWSPSWGPSRFWPGFTYPAISLFTVTLNLVMLETKKCSDVTLRPSKDEEGDSL